MCVRMRSRSNVGGHPRAFHGRSRSSNEKYKADSPSSCLLGAMDGTSLPTSDGTSLSLAVGLYVGTLVVGEYDGTAEGSFEGLPVGSAVGSSVGSLVSSWPVRGWRRGSGR